MMHSSQTREDASDGEGVAVFTTDPAPPCPLPLQAPPPAPPCPAPRQALSEHEFSCHCCYDILVSPTTLTCGHSFCRHCLALWWGSSHKTECPECRETWEGFPKVNILLRDAVEKLFSEIVERRKTEIQNNKKIFKSLQAFQRYGDEQALRSAPRTSQRRGTGGFFSGVLTALTCVAVLLLGYHWSSGEAEEGGLGSKPVSRWTSEEVLYWLENLGPWAQLYTHRFLHANVNGRLLLMLGDEELALPPYSMENQAHRRAVLAELERVVSLGGRPPQNLWEYKAVNGGKSLFLLYALKSSPRLTLLYLYLFDYHDSFLPFLLTCCPALTPAGQPMEDSLHLNTQLPLDRSTLQPSGRQWAEFLVKYFLLPYQLIAEFAWDWLSVHYWTSRFIIVNAMLLSVLEGCFLYRLWSRSEIRSFPGRVWGHLWRVLPQGVALALLWPVIPHFICNCLFYWALYFNPIINIDLVVQQLLHPDTHAA